MQTKVCSHCRVKRDVILFGPNRRASTGLKSQCNPCRRAYYLANRERILASQKPRQLARREEINRYWRDRRRRDPQFRLAINLRTRLNRAVAIDQKAGSAVRDLGCSITELRAYLESKFAPGMTWGNYGAWHIDHIVPLSRVDLSDLEQFRKACHYTNLQPLWAIDNWAKGNKVNS